jgi:hypothetical protein
MKRIALVILAIFLAVPSIAHADEASKHAKIQELFTVLHLDKTMKLVMDAVLKQVKDASQQQLVGVTLTDAQQKKFDDFQQKVFDIVNDQMSWAKIEPDYIKLYDDAYTEEQIDGILSFYKSPVGQAMIAKSPELTTKSLQISQGRMQAIQPQLRQLMQDFTKDMAALSTTKSN